MTVLPARCDITIEKDRDWSVDIRVTDLSGTAIDLTGYMVVAQIRAKRARSADLIASFVVTEVDWEDGNFNLSLADTVTSEFTQNRGWYDVLLISPADLRETYLHGEVTINDVATDV